MARRVPFKIVVRLCMTALFVCLVTLYFCLWNNGVPVNTSNSRSMINGGPLPHLNLVHKFKDDIKSKGSWPIGPMTTTTAPNNKPKEPTKVLVLTLVVCGDRFNESVVVIKSAIVFTTSSLHLIIITEDSLKPKFERVFEQWPKAVQNRVFLSVRPLSFPQDGTAQEWKHLFKLCASQRLFIPSLLQDVDATIYVDTDVVFLRPLDDIWGFFGEMNSSQLAAMTPEHEDYATGWYNRFAQHPYFKPLGVNSGVMLMNLTRMREFQWESHLPPIYEKYKQKITWGDQDILNILFHSHPDKLFVYLCDWNYRPDHCMYTSVCKSAEKHGVAMVHGNRGVFHSRKHPAFKAIYDTFQKYNLGENVRAHLIEPLRRNLQQTEGTNCGKMYSIFMKRLEKYESPAR